MFFVIKRSSIILLSVSLALGLLASITTIGVRSKMVWGLPVTNKVVLIDAGHGGLDGGAVGGSGTIEKEINLKISQKLQAFFEQSGCVVIMTRDDDDALDQSGKKSIRQNKRDDLASRKQLIGANQPDIAISVHLNKFTQSQYRGAQVFYLNNSPDSKRLAQLVTDSLDAISPHTRDIKPIPSDVFLFKELTIPTVLVECGFLSNPDDERLLNDNEYQKRIAWCIYTAAIDYFKNSTQ